MYSTKLKKDRDKTLASVSCLGVLHYNFKDILKLHRYEAVLYDIFFIVLRQSSTKFGFSLDMYKANRRAREFQPAAYPDGAHLVGKQAQKYNFRYAGYPY